MDAHGDDDICKEIELEDIVSLPSLYEDGYVFYQILSLFVFSVLLNMVVNSIADSYQFITKFLLLRLTTS